MHQETYLCIQPFISFSSLLVLYGLFTLLRLLLLLLLFGQLMIAHEGIRFTSSISFAFAVVASVSLARSRSVRSAYYHFPLFTFPRRANHEIHDSVRLLALFIRFVLVSLEHHFDGIIPSELLNGDGGRECGLQR